MCFMSAPKPPPPPPPPAPIELPPLPEPKAPDPLPELPKPVDPAVRQARENNLRTANQYKGRGSTILTSGQGLTDPADGRKKTLLGA